jgi:hypothetical protein
MDHRKIIDESLWQLMSLAEERDRIEHQMGKLHLAARAHLNLLENKAEREALKAALDTYRVRIGLSDLVKLCLYLADKPMTPVEIRNFILNFGSESSTQPNLLQSVHTILTRLKGEVVKEEINDDGDKAFRLLTIAERIVKTGVDASAANKAGKEVENKFDLKGSGWYQNMMDTLDATVIVTNPDGEPSLVVRPKQAYGNAGLRAKLKDIKRDR